MSCLFSCCRRLWDVDCGACLRTLEGHNELVRLVHSLKPPSIVLAAASCFPQFPAKTDIFNRKLVHFPNALAGDCFLYFGYV